MHKAYFNYKYPNPPGKSKFQHGILDRNDQNSLLVSHSNYPGRKTKQYSVSCQANFTEIHTHRRILCKMSLQITNHLLR